MHKEMTADKINNLIEHWNQGPLTDVQFGGATKAVGNEKLSNNSSSLV